MNDQATIAVTRFMWPSVYDALDLIAVAVGEGGWPSYSVPARWQRWLETFEADLDGLDERDRIQFCVGHHTEQTRIAEDHRLHKLREFLDEFAEE